MSVGVLVVLLVVFVGLLVLSAVGAMVARRKRVQFSLRAMLGVFGLVALAFSLWFSWQWWITAPITWIDPSSPEAAKVVPAPRIIEEEGKFRVTFTPRYRDVQELYSISEGRHRARNLNSMVQRDQERIDLESSERSEIEGRLAALDAIDVPASGRLVIHGRVEDSQGRPVAKATVDLMGPVVYVNHFTSRPNGTFTRFSGGLKARQVPRVGWPLYTGRRGAL